MRVYGKDGRARPHSGWVVLGWVWIELSSIATGQTVIGAITRPSLQPTALAVYEAANRVFVADDATKKIYMFDGVTHAELNSVSSNGGIDRMVVHEPSGKLFALGGSVWVIDALTGALIRELPGYWSYGLALDSDAGKLYAISFASGLRQIDTSNYSETTVAGVDLTGSPAVNPVTHEVFLLGGGGLNIVDGSTLRVTKATFPGGSSLAVNWLENKVYSGWPGNAIYSRKTNAVTRIGIGENQNDASEMTFNPAGNRVYTGMEIDGWTTIIDGPTDATWNLPFQTTAYPAPVVLLNTNHVYFPGSKFTIALDDTSQMFKVIPVNNPNGGGILSQAIAANQRTGRVYVVNDSRMGSVAVLQDTPWRCSASIAPTGAVMVSNGWPVEVSVATSPECSWAVAEPSPDSVLFDVKPPIHAGSGTVTISAFDNNSLSSRVASVKIAGQLFTVTQGSTSEVMTTLSAASYALNGPLAEQMIVCGFGLGLAYVSGSASAVSGLPTSLNGVTVKVKDSAGTERVAPLWYVSPGQINYYIPEGTKTGTATVTVSYVTRVLATGTLQIEAVAPGLFAANANGAGVAAALAVWAHSDSSQSWQYVFAQPCIPGSCHSAPLDLGSENDRLYLQLYGTGIRGRSSLLAVTAKIGGVDAPVEYAGPVAGMIGLDQVNLRVPPSLRGRGEVGVVVTVDGKPANTVAVQFK